MSRRRVLFSVIAPSLALVLILWPRPATGDSRDEAIVLEYRAGGGCPDQASFMTSVRNRAARARLAVLGEHVRTFVVVLDAGPPATGSVTIQQAGRPHGSREVRADTCAEVADALALVVALAVDPLGGQAPKPPSAERNDELTAEAQSDAAPSSGASPFHRTPTSALRAGADFVAVTGVAPDVVLSLSPFVEWSRTGAWWKPSVRVAFERTTTGALSIAGGEALFTWTVGRLDACPLGLGSGAVRFAACARLEAGALEVNGRGDRGAQQQRVPWVAAGPAARGEWSPFAGAFVDAEVAPLLRAYQDRFFFFPDTTVYRVPALGLGAAIGIGARFL